MDDYELDEALRSALDRLALLADVSEALAGTLDEREGLERVWRLLTQRLVDWCAIDLLRDDDQVERVCAGTRNAGLEASRGDERIAWPATDPGSALTPARRGVRPVLLDPSGLRSLPREAPWERAFAAEAERRDVASVIVAPLRTRHEVLGAIVLGRFRSHPSFGDPELALVQDLAHRVGLALDNARLYAGSENISERLQRSMLPELPRIDGFTTAARYAPSGTAAQVGGDWYDMFSLPEGAGTALIVGDVVGHDLRAAVTMSQIRNMLRGIACDRQEPPESIVHRLDTAMGMLYPEISATCVYGVLRTEPEGGAGELDYTSAGHPPPLLVPRNGRARFLTSGHGPLLGVDPALPRTGAAAFLPAGSTLLLYTDGLVERRGEPLDHGLTRLRRNAAALTDASPEEVCDRLLTAQAPDTATTGDDVALLVIRLS
ncbi:PP2C family protein-serine/threonine phosphatase [Actinospica robiniae]|uniref:PP2C family protein-serine/threonine phosphatase n=1 Tax=Actinospica robiniae TaxID=304901 RepID=UPI0004034CA8|nr:GAF domain-containing SpoIIE family protein phosphatase [Actinospica robiniae]